MWYDRYGGWAPYVPVAERRRRAQRELAKLGRQVSPVAVTGRQIAGTFWGKAWCSNLERYRDFENRLPRGRSYVRNGSVVDLQIGKGEIRAMVSGSSLYSVAVSIGVLPKPKWRSICGDCAGGIDSVVELLQGRLSDAVMQRVCAPGKGLFPQPSEIRFACSCPDSATMCKHVAAVMYGVGARLDQRPELLFELRAVDQRELVTNLEGGLLLPEAAADAKVLDGEDISALFGLDMDDTIGKTPAGPGRTPAKADAKGSKPVAASKRSAKQAPAKRRANKPAAQLASKPRGSGAAAARSARKGAAEPAGRSTRSKRAAPFLVAKLSANSRLTLPRQVIDILGPVSRVRIEIDGDRVVLSPERPDTQPVVRQKAAGPGIKGGTGKAGRAKKG